MINTIYPIFYLFTYTVYATYALFIPDCNKKSPTSTFINFSPKPSVILSIIPEPKTSSLTFPIILPSTHQSTSTISFSPSITQIMTTQISTSTLPSTSTVSSITPPVNSLENDCLSMHNQVRAMYNPSAQALTWDSSLAFRCANVAQYCATVSQTHFDLGDNATTPGLFVNAQNLFITKTSCSSSYDGWITNEVTQNGGHYLNIINGDYSRVGCSVSYEGLTCICCDFTI